MVGLVRSGLVGRSGATRAGPASVYWIGLFQATSLARKREGQGGSHPDNDAVAGRSGDSQPATLGLAHVLASLFSFHRRRLIRSVDYER